MFQNYYYHMFCITRTEYMLPVSLILDINERFLWFNFWICFLNSQQIMQSLCHFQLSSPQNQIYIALWMLGCFYIYWTFRDCVLRWCKWGFPCKTMRQKYSIATLRPLFCILKKNIQALCNTRRKSKLLIQRVA